MVLAEKKELKPFNAIFFCGDCGQRRTVACSERELAKLFNHMGVLELLPCWNCDYDTFHRFSGHFEPNHNRKYSRGYLGPIKKPVEVKKVGGFRSHERKGRKGR